MRSRPLPERTSNTLPITRLKNDPQVKKWAERLIGDPTARPNDLSEDQLLYVMEQVMKRRGDEFDGSQYEKAMRLTSPRIVAPDITDIAEDLEACLNQPELEQFWQNWVGPVGRAAGPNYAAAKAVMTGIGMGSIAPYVQTATQLVSGNQELTRVFSELEARTRNAAFEFAPYSTVTRLAGKLAPSCTALAMTANISLAKALRKLRPDADVGKYLLIDGKAVPAWTAQRGSNGNEAIEARLRARTPQAGFRMLQHTSNGKQDIGSGDKLSVAGAGRVTRWRGYYLVVIVDLMTTLPLVWILQDAALDEAAAIVPLLSDLHRLWPDIGAEFIAGDSAWDEDAWCRLCEVDYGIHPVFRLHPSHRANQKPLSLPTNATKSGSVRQYKRDGQLICAAHNAHLPYETFQPASRQGLRPGQSAPEGEFRVRGNCTHGRNACGRIGVQAKHNWSTFTFLPHFKDGDPKRHALRLALETRLASSESVFNRLEAGKLLGGEGAHRTRVVSMETHESLISLALLGMTSLTVAEQRNKANVAKPSGSAPAPWVSPLAA